MHTEKTIRHLSHNNLVEYSVSCTTKLMRADILGKYDLKYERTRGHWQEQFDLVVIELKTRLARLPQP